MNLIDEARAEDLYAAMGQTVIISGGSAANTAVGAAKLGARSAFIGKVRDDEVGGYFTHDLRGTGVHFATAPAVDGPATARSYILVTPDGQRTMNTYLGACQNLTVDDVDPDLVRASGVVYLEGYLWDPPAAKDAFRKASDIAHEAGRSVALSLSDSFCVGRYRDEFLDLIRSKKVDIVFANEDELLALYEVTVFDQGGRGVAAGLRARGRDARRQGRRRGGEPRHQRGSGVPDRTRGGLDRRRRPLRGGFPGRSRAQPQQGRLRPPWRARSRRDHRPRGRPSAGRPRGSGRCGRHGGLKAITAQRRMRQASVQETCPCRLSRASMP